jgi:hypothetical protein
MERDNKMGSDIMDASKLPFPREVILESFCREYLWEEDENMQCTMRNMVTYLADYQEGVGVENLEMMGGIYGNNYMDELKKFPICRRLGEKRCSLAMSQALIDVADFKW